MLTMSLRRLFQALPVVLSLALPAQAATVSFSDTLPIVAVANSLASSVTGALVTLDENVTGTVVNNRRSPWDAPNSIITLTAAPYSALRNGSATFDQGVVRGGLSLVWGTPGPLNVLELFLGGVSQLRLSGPAAVGANGAAFSRLTTITNVRFDQVVLSAGNPAFEFANFHVAAVPLPAGGLLLIGACGMLIAMRRRTTAV